MFYVPIPNPDGSAANTYLLTAQGAYSYGKIYFAKIDEQGNLFDIAIKEVPNVHSFQSAIHFINPTTFVGRGLEKQPFFANSNVQGNLMCFDTDYNLLWRKGYCTNKERDHYTRGMLPTQDGGYLLTGLSMEGYAWEAKVDSLGNTCWFNKPPQWEEATDPEGNPYYTAGCDSLHLVPWTVGIDETFPPLGAQGGVSIAPNPADDVVYIEWNGKEGTNLTIYDMNKKPMMKVRLETGNNPVSIRALPIGIYLLQIEGTAQVSKLSIVR
ncbi:MAG: T9SS type A sorting domain-containing protein [Sphingobacteriales bacterium]|nr:T9SS type A sorting domain-containing protein [Sphingobacteriales bacterium]